MLIVKKRNMANLRSRKQGGMVLLMRTLVEATLGMLQDKPNMLKAKHLDFLHCIFFCHVHFTLSFCSLSISPCFNHIKIMYQKKTTSKYVIINQISIFFWVVLNFHQLPNLEKKKGRKCSVDFRERKRYWLLWILF